MKLKFPLRFTPQQTLCQKQTFSWVWSKIIQKKNLGKFMEWSIRVDDDMYNVRVGTNDPATGIRTRKRMETITMATKTTSSPKAARKPAASKAKKSSKRKPNADGSPKHPALHGIATRGRNFNGKPSAKHQIFEMWLKAPAKFNVESVVSKKLKTNRGTLVKASTIRSWVGNWKAGLSSDGKTGGFYPAILESKLGGAAALRKALASLGKKKS